ncbi:gamma-butyrobetaine hydroxylase-like domain-containing protein [Nannocystis pusilla]|uniref:gamma-butyrobetaine hydroxylase-like domain-containing protein n=1 Tax=Nannocystis pusilla TaxID=889268 RepID=UPI003B7B558E
MVPVDIAHHVKEAVLEVTWDDGSTSRLSAALLRGWCPCATCQGIRRGCASTSRPRA